MPAPDPVDELATLHFLWFRADYLRTRWIDLSHEAHETVGLEVASSDFSTGYGFPIWVCVTMHLASLYTVVQGWHRLRLADSDVDRVLAVEGRETTLRELRDGVFHFGAMNNPAILYVLENREFLEWAKELHAALGRFMDRRPNTVNGPSDR